MKTRPDASACFMEVRSPGSPDPTRQQMCRGFREGAKEPTNRLPVEGRDASRGEGFNDITPLPSWCAGSPSFVCLSLARLPARSGRARPSSRILPEFSGEASFDDEMSPCRRPWAERSSLMLLLLVTRHCRPRRHRLRPRQRRQPGRNSSS